MIEKLECQLCGANWNCHGYQRSMIMYQHYKNIHSNELDELKKAAEDFYKAIKKHKASEFSHLLC